MPTYASTGDRLSRYSFVAICTFIFIFLITPILIIVPLSFNAEPYFTFTEGMLNFEANAFSLRWYEDIVHNGMVDPDAVSGWWGDMWNNAQWIRSTRNSFFIATISALIATTLGTIAALGLSRPEMPYRALITSLLISPMIVPLVITATGMFFFYSSINLAKTYTGVILAHATLGIPFVIITVTATLSGFDRTLIKASQGLGARGWMTFRRVIMPLIMPGMISGALFAFITSLDEVVAVIFIADVEQRTIPRQMFSGIREQISPTILAVASILVLLSIVLLTVMELLRRRSERMRGITPS
ncbi:MAG: ABC transporter permease [Gammaproteobacteria bacterium]|nr:ABC transporter permease [Gammaproteobacteria bacterium]